MKGLIFKYMVVFSLVLASGALLMDVSHQVQRTEHQISRLEREIAQEQDSIHVLKAEWAYLNDPARFEVLVSGGLDLVSPDVAALVSRLPVPEEAPSSVVSIKPSPIQRDISYSSPSLPSSPVQVQSSLFVETSLSTQNTGAQ